MGSLTLKGEQAQVGWTKSWLRHEGPSPVGMSTTPLRALSPCFGSASNEHPLYRQRAVPQTLVFTMAHRLNFGKPVV